MVNSILNNLNPTLTMDKFFNKTPIILEKLVKWINLIRKTLQTYLQNIPNCIIILKQFIKRELNLTNLPFQESDCKDNVLIFLKISNI